MKFSLLKISNPTIYRRYSTPEIRIKTFFETPNYVGEHLVFDLQDVYEYIVRLDNMEFSIGGFIHSFRITKVGNKLKSDNPYILLGYETCE